MELRAIGGGLGNRICGGDTADGLGCGIVWANGPTEDCAGEESRRGEVVEFQKLLDAKIGNRS